MAPSAAPRQDTESAADKNDYDPEILNMADYIHNYKIDSDLAVCRRVAAVLI